MYVFNYDPATGQSLGGTVAEFDQLEPGRVIVPAHATATPPPSNIPAGSAAFFNVARAKWEVRDLSAVNE
jgi:hypothetical protein